MQKNDFEVNIIGPLEIDSSQINNQLFSILIDGAITHNLKLKQFITCGDGDSSNSKLQYQLPIRKDYSDFSYALGHIPSSAHTIYAHGLFGGRLDHQLCILGETSLNLQNNHRKYVFYDLNIVKMICISAGKWNFSHFGLFSLHSLEKQKIQIKGKAEYKTDMEYAQLNPLSSYTLSNKAYGIVEIENEKPLTIYLNYGSEV